jgi:hypothetical protein
VRIYADVEQGSDAWLHLRLGIPTASNFHKIVTPKKCELSKGATDYALRLIAERLLNATSESSIQNPWIERGKDLEPMAVQQYEFTHDVQTVPVGFITTDDGMIGCSPDRLVASDFKVALEIKCPSPHVHLGYLLNGTDDDYKPQVQGQILVAELDRAELYSFHERMPPALIQNFRDADYLTKLDAALKLFNENMLALLASAQALGVYQPMPRSVTKAEVVELADLAHRLKTEAAQRMAKEGFIA